MRFNSNIGPPLKNDIHPHFKSGKNKYNTGLSENNFRRIAERGFGDPYNAYPHAMTWHKGHLYVGTTRANLAYRGRWRYETDQRLLGEIWPVRIPVGLFDFDLRAEIWRYHPPADEWKRVFKSPLVKGIDGFDVPLSIGFRAIISFKGTSDPKAVLYIPTWGSHQTPEAVMLRSEDGAHFEISSEPGLGFPDPYKPRAIRAFTTYKGRVFIAPAVGAKRMEPNTSGFMVILVSEDPASARWEFASEPHFGDPNNMTVFHMAEYNGFLYAGTMNVNEGYQVWKTDAEGKPPYKWKKVIGFGAYRGKYNQIAITLCPFKGQLYVGSAIQGGGYDNDNRVGPGQPEIIRLNPDDSWELLVGEPRHTPDGYKSPLSCLQPGFGKPFVGYLWSMGSHDGWLYAGTFDWTTNLKYMGTKVFPERLQRIITPQFMEGVVEKIGGFDLWKTYDGITWLPVTNNGFGNPFNYGIRNMVSSPHGFFIGAANPFGPDVAVRRKAGWNYEENLRGGAEIWLGSSDFFSDYVSDKDGKQNGNVTPQVVLPDVEDGYEDKGDEPTEEEKINKYISRLYDGSGFFHFGFWRDDIKNMETACKNLMDEILAFIPEKKGTVLDFGCGTGAGTEYLTRYFSPESITGIAFSKISLKNCRRKVSGARFFQKRFAGFVLPSESIDNAIWARDLFPLKGPRNKIFQLIFRVLKHEGRLVCFDYLDNNQNGIMKKAASFFKPSIDNADAYHEILKSIGFDEIRIMDSTYETATSFRKHLSRYFALKIMAGELDGNDLQKIRERLNLNNVMTPKCFLIVARKP